MEDSETKDETKDDEDNEYLEEQAIEEKLIEYQGKSVLKAYKARMLHRENAIGHIIDKRNRIMRYTRSCFENDYG